jgi:hypothetical protein
MIRWFVPACFILLSPLAAEDSTEWVQKHALSASADGVSWGREEFRSFLESRSIDQKEKYMDDDEDFSVCLSMSVPRSMWMQIARSKTPPRRILLRGLPPRGLLHLQGFLQSLKREGFKATVQIDSRPFRRHKIRSVPCYISGDSTVYGAISPECALEKLRGDRA